MPVARLLACVCAIVCCGSALAQGTAKQTVPTQVLALDEMFGVDFPEQVVEFALAAPARAGVGRLVDSTGKAAAFQLIDNGRKIAVRTDLPKGSRRQWSWLPDQRSDPAAAAQPGGVAIHPLADGLEISNELIAIRLPSADAIKASAGRKAEFARHQLLELINISPDRPRVLALAPIQGVRLHTGEWTARGPNLLTAHANALTDTSVTVMESGPLKVTVRLAYTFDRPAYAYGQVAIAGAGPGHLTVTLTVRAGQPSIELEEETDLDEVWAINVHAGLAPSEARYLGHHASDRRFGRPVDSPVAGSDMPTPGRNQEAIVALQYNHPQIPSYRTTDQSFQLMAVWNPWIVDSGWYWQLYDAAAPATSNVVGIFAGATSKARGAALSGAGILTLPPDAAAGRGPVAGIESQSYRRAPDGRIATSTRFAWGLFLGAKGRDLAAGADRMPTINQQMNLLAGPLTLTKLAAMELRFADPPGGYGGLYMSRQALADVVARVRHGYADGRKGAYGWLHSAEPMSRPLIDAWADASGAKMQEAAADIERLATDVVSVLVHGHGTYAAKYSYWQGGLEMMRRGLWIDQVLASDTVPPAQKVRIKAIAALFGYILWDNDFVPLDADHGLNFGTANMPVQQGGYRSFYALLLAGHRDFASRAPHVLENAIHAVRGQLNEGGAHMGSPHYINASFMPTLNTLMQIKQLGATDPFATEPRLARFAEFTLNLLTPPEVRFPGQPRNLIALGDSSTESSPLLGQLGTALRDAAPALSRRLMAAWRASGQPHSGFFGTTVMSIDDRLAAEDVTLTSAAFPGYYSVLRTAYATPDETAAWIVYRDHRHIDAGNLVYYALGVPLSVHWGAIYYPQTPSPYFHSSIVREDAIGRPWDQPAPPLTVATAGLPASGWAKSEHVSLSRGKDVDTSVSRFTTADLEWTRTLTLLHEAAALPVLVIDDSFTGAAAATDKVLTLNLMAAGVVDTPWGPVSPAERTHLQASAAKSADELPSASPPHELAPGLARFGFKGQFGVDFDVYVLSQTRQQALLGNWAVSWTQQMVRNWQERQHILRIRGNGPFKLAIVAYRAGQRPSDHDVTLSGNDLILSVGRTRRKL